jgi:hypothetical protein
MKGDEFMKHTDRHNRPVAPPPNFDNIPQQMRKLVQWVLWRYDWRSGDGGTGRAGEWAKVPYQRDGRHAKSNDPATWDHFEKIRTAFEGDPGGHDGVGFVFTRKSRIVGIDIDDCVTWESSKHAPGIVVPKFNDWAQRTLDRLDGAFVEFSPSRTGLHFYCFANPAQAVKHSEAGFEMYPEGRYFTVTGDALNPVEALPDKTGDVDFILSAVLALRGEKAGDRVAQTPKSDSRPVSASTNGIRETAIGLIRGPRGLHTSIEQRLEIAFRADNGQKIRELFEGNLNGYPSQSEADLALAGFLKFYSDGHPLILTAMMRRSKLDREKWDKPVRAGGLTHLEQVIEKTLTDEYTFWRIPAGLPEILTTDINESQRFSFGQLAKAANEYRHMPAMQGLSQPWANVSEIWRPRKGLMSVVLAKPSRGKSTLVNAKTYHYAMCHRWRTGIVAFETSPERLTTLVTQIHLRQPTLSYHDAACTDEQFFQACREINEQFTVFKLAWDDCNAESIIKLCEIEIAERGLDALVIDTFTSLNQPSGSRRNQLDFINDSLKILFAYTRKRNLYIDLVVHPTKAGGRRGNLDLDDACGTHLLRSVPDFGVILTRGNDDILVLEMGKVRENMITGIEGGQAALKYDPYTNNYFPTPVPIRAIERKERKQRQESNNGIPF